MIHQTNTYSQSIQKQEERPMLITIICVLGFLGAGLSVPMMFSDIAFQIGEWFPPYSGFIAAVSLTCMIGLWFRKKWAAQTYIHLVVFNQIVLITMGLWSMMILVIQGVIILIILLYFDPKVQSMSHNLARYIKRQIYAIIIAYMVGLHNVYKEEDKTADDIVITVENSDHQENSTPKD